jgi:hypothetical protein
MSNISACKAFRAVVVRRTDPAGAAVGDVTSKQQARP